MREPKELESLRLSLTTLCTSLGCEQPEHDQTCLFGMQLQRETPQSPTEFLKETLRVCFLLKSNNGIVCIPHDDDLAARMPLPPLFDPQIDDVV